MTPGLPFLEQEASVVKPRQPEIIRVHIHIKEAKKYSKTYTVMGEY